MLQRARAIAPKNSLILASIEVDLMSFMERQRAPQVAAMHRESAKDTLFSADWKNADIDDRFVLLHYAVECYMVDRAGSSKALTLALSRQGKKDIKLFLEHDDRIAIFAEFARGLLQSHRDFAKSVDVILDCQKRWLAIGYKRRATEAGIKLLRLGTDEGQEDLEQLLRAVPKSAYVEEIKSIKGHPTSILSDAERRVAHYICEGLTSRQIAEQLDRSPATIRNQTISIYRRLGVSTRSALVSLIKDAGAA